MTIIPTALQQVLDNLSLEGLPSATNPGDRITLELKPSLRPTDGQLPKVLADLSVGEVLATLNIDPGPLVNWIIDAVKVNGWTKDVEFDLRTDATAEQLAAPANTKRALPHQVPDPTGVLATSPNVRGALSQATLTRDTTAAVEQLLGRITKPGILGTISPAITVNVKVTDETGRNLSPGTDFFVSNDFVPALVFPPVAVPSRTAQPTVRRNISVHVAVPYTDENGKKETARGQLGPYPLDLATVEVPLVAVLARHALVQGAAPGHVFVGVPENSPLDSLGDVLDNISTLRSLTRNLVDVLQLFGVDVPTAVAETLRVLDFLPTVASDFRFGKGDLLGLWALFADWQYIMSAAIVLGSPSRRAFFGSVSGTTLAGFSLWPGSLGVGFIPELAKPIESAATMGTVEDNFPLPAGTSYDNMLTSINFPAS